MSPKPVPPHLLAHPPPTLCGRNFIFPQWQEARPSLHEQVHMCELAQPIPKEVQMLGLHSQSTCAQNISGRSIYICEMGGLGYGKCTQGRNVKEGKFKCKM